VGWAHVVGPGLGQPMYLGLTRPILKNFKCLFQNVTNFLVYFSTSFLLISICILHHKNTISVLKYLVFIKTSKNAKKLKKRKKMFLCIRPSVSKLKNHIVFFIHQKNNGFSMHFGFNNQFIKVKRTLAKISKTTKILCCFVLVSRITNLYVKRIPDIKKNIFDNIEQLGFTPLR
jgi:hypothetical protein